MGKFNGKIRQPVRTQNCLVLVLVNFSGCAFSADTRRVDVLLQCTNYCVANNFWLIPG